MRRVVLAWCLVCLASSLLAQSKPPRLSSADLKTPLIWGSEASSPDDFKLAFGGLDQESGNPHTRVWRDGQWVNIAEELQATAPFAKAIPYFTPVLRVTELGYRSGYLSDQYGPSTAEGRESWKQSFDDVRERTRQFVKVLEKYRGKLSPYEQGQASLALKSLAEIEQLIPPDTREYHTKFAVDLGKARHLAQQVEDLLGYEPPARALSPLIYDPHSKLFVLFGGDHLDYISNDLWVFDPKELKWEQRHPELSPAPRANHQWEVLEGGKLKLTGGYRYTSSTDYCGAQYKDIGDGPWIYDVASNTWSGEGKLQASSQREFRTGALHPDYYLEGPVPNVAAFQELLQDLPVNTWVATKPPRKPKLNRDWGTAVYYPGTQEILRYSGGHSAHGGTDVLHYSTRTNRWLLTDPVEFPLGQLYTNTEYPAGRSFNGRPWLTGHTYQSYACSAQGTMPFVGQSKRQFLYKPEMMDWVGTIEPYKPAGMNYGDCFYTLTLCTTPSTIYCWTNEGRIFDFDDDGQWRECKLQGEKLPGSSVDNSTLTYDAQRKRLLFFRKDYGDDHKYNGVIHALDLKTMEVTKLVPEGADVAHKISYLCQLRYDPKSDLVLCGCTLPPDESGLRRTPAYDPAGNRWVSLKIVGEDPSGPKGRNVSLGMMVDEARGLFWATDTNCEVYVMRLERTSADVQPLK